MKKGEWDVEFNQSLESMLYEYPELTKKILELQRELNETLQNKEEVFNSLKAAAATGMPNGSELSDITYNAVEKIIDKYDKLIQRLAFEINNLIDKKEFINNKLVLLTPFERIIVDFRFFQCLQWGIITRKIHYNRSHCFRIYHEAIKKMKINYSGIKDETK